MLSASRRTCCSTLKYDAWNKEVEPVSGLLSALLFAAAAAEGRVQCTVDVSFTFFNLHSLIKWLCFIHHLITISGCYSLFCAHRILAKRGKIATLSSSLTTSVHAVGGAAMHVAKQSDSETVGLFPKRRDDDCGRRRWSVTHLEFSQTLWSWIEKMKGEPEDIFF